MVSRPIYFVSTVGVMIFCFTFFLTFFNEGLPNKLPIGVVDLDNSALSRQFTRNLNATQQSDVVMRLNSHGEAREEMQKGNIYAFVEINRDFAANAVSNKRPKIVFYINNGYLITGSLSLKNIMTMAGITSAGMQQQILKAKGMDDSRIMGIIQPIAVDAHRIGNPMTNYGAYLLNVLLPSVLSLSILMITLFAVGVEMKERTSREWLQKAGNSIFAGLMGKLLPYTVIFTLLGVISNLLLFSYMKYPLNTSIGWMFLDTFLFVLAYQSIGVFIIGLIPVLRDSVTIGALYGLLGVTYAGVTFPIEHMLYVMQIFSDLFPVRHYFNIYVNQALHGLPIGHSVISFVALLSFNILPFFVYHRLKNAAINQNYPIK